MFPCPFQNGRHVVVPFISYHSLDPWSGWRRRRIVIFQVPYMKSKSCVPSWGVACETAPVTRGGSARVGRGAAQAAHTTSVGKTTRSAEVESFVGFVMPPTLAPKADSRNDQTPRDG